MSLTNFTHKTNWRLDLTQERFSPMFQLMVQEVTLPAYEIPAVRLSTNPRNKAMIAGSGIDIEPLRVRILIDEEFKAYTEIYQWMQSLTGHLDEVATLEKEFPSHLILNLLDNEKNLVIAIKFYGAWPFRLGELEYVFNEQGNIPVGCDVMFYYKWFEIERDGVIIRPFQPDDIRKAPHIELKNSAKSHFGLHPFDKKG